MRYILVASLLLALISGFSANASAGDDLVHEGELTTFFGGDLNTVGTFTLVDDDEDDEKGGGDERRFINDNDDGDNDDGHDDGHDDGDDDGDDDSDGVNGGSDS